MRLMIAPGAKVSEGQPVMELETEKAVVEVPSSVTGIVNEVKVKEGEKIKVGQLIFTLQGATPSPEKPLVRRASLSSTFPGSTARGWRSRLRFGRRVKPKSRRCLPTSRCRRPLHFPCPCNWAR